MAHDHPECLVGWAKIQKETKWTIYWIKNNAFNVSEKKEQKLVIINMQIVIIKSEVYLLSTTPDKNYAIGDSLVESLDLFVCVLFCLEYNTICMWFFSQINPGHGW